MAKNLKALISTFLYKNLNSVMALIDHNIKKIFIIKQVFF